MAQIDAYDPDKQLEVQLKQKERMSYIPLWMKIGTSRIEDSHARFHQEVFDFAEWASVSDYKSR